MKKKKTITRRMKSSLTRRNLKSRRKICKTIIMHSRRRRTRERMRERERTNTRRTMNSLSKNRLTRLKSPRSKCLTLQKLFSIQ
jgi:hypothetical protein